VAPRGAPVTGARQPVVVVSVPEALAPEVDVLEVEVDEVGVVVDESASREVLLVLEAVPLLELVLCVGSLVPVAAVEAGGSNSHVPLTQSVGVVALTT
jgi:hypothetical protein